MNILKQRWLKRMRSNEGIKKEEIPFPSLSKLLIEMFEKTFDVLTFEILDKDEILTFVKDGKNCLICSEEDFRIIKLGLECLIRAKSRNSNEHKKAKNILWELCNI